MAKANLPEIPFDSSNSIGVYLFASLHSHIAPFSVRCEHANQLDEDVHILRTQDTAVDAWQQCSGHSFQEIP